ncbi:MAG: 4-hydroxy-tetrahydrodipicolinate reductase, partial [Candidatus Omnitrophica bacterium]|nr:4-hydroxy-tetrahydrodipicolinate reductase [Candidatus Omnitrophota bacterium]
GKKISDAIGIEGANEIISPDIESLLGKTDCLIEFTLPESTMEHLEICRKKRVPMVIGTTGLKKEEEKKIRSAAMVIPIVFSPNMAVGVNVLFKIVHDTAKILQDDFAVKIDETHHVHKKDSPSGTAKMIAEVIREACGAGVPIEAFRKGEVIGNHCIIFENEFERLEIRHDAKSRDVFAVGALKAAKFVVGKKPGLYTMRDVLGIG